MTTLGGGGCGEGCGGGCGEGCGGAKKRSVRVRVYADGVFDLLHPGHLRLLERLKKTPSLGAPVHLMVGVNSDEDALAHKGAAPVMRHAERVECVRACRWVDEVVPDAPWVLTEAFLEARAIDFVAHDGDPYPTRVGADVVDDIYAVPKALGRFIATERTPGVSTTEIVRRVLLSRRDAA